MNTDKNIMTEKNLVVMSRVALNEYEVEKGVRLNLGKRKAFIDGFEKCWRLIDQAPTVDQWHYPSRGEIPDKDWSKHPLNVSKECFVLTKFGIGTIARWDNDCIMWFERPHLPVLEVIAWQYFVPPKEEV